MRAYLLLLLPLLLGAASLPQLIENAKNTHSSLEAIEEKISALDAEYEASKNLANPELSLSMSDIQLQDASNRSLEPMQYSSISIKQKLPYFGKRDAAANKVSAQKNRTLLTLEEAKVKLIETLKITAYSLWQKEEETKITDAYIELMRQTISINAAYGSSDTKYNMALMAAELTLSQLKIKKFKLQSAQVALYKRLSYLSGMDVDSLELSMPVHEPKSIEYYQNALHENSSYKVKEATTLQAKAELKIKELAAYIDPSLQVGYYRRESFEDYVSVGVAFSLPIYGTEKAQEEAAQKLLLSSQKEAADFKNLLNAELADVYARLQNAYKEYTIIKDDALPQLEHMLRLANASIQSGSELFVSLELLQKRLSLEEQNIDAVANYHKTLASLEAIIGEIQ
jgi:outer membrane protein TolC